MYSGESIFYWWNDDRRHNCYLKCKRGLRQLADAPFSLLFLFMFLLQYVTHERICFTGFAGFNMAGISFFK
jgi:hypothetical protein